MIPIVLLSVLFIVIIFPILSVIFNFVSNIFTALVCIDIIKNPCNDKSVRSFIRHFTKKDLHFLRKFLIRFFHKEIIYFLSRINRSNFESNIYYHSYGGKARNEFDFKINLVIKNIVLLRPAMMNELQSIIIEKATKFRNPRIIYNFALVMKDTNFSKKNLFVAISKIDNSYRDIFAKHFRYDKEIEKLASLL